MIVMAQNDLEFFEKVEGGWFLPEENEEDFINFINKLNNKIQDLQQALKEERAVTDELLEIKNEKIQSLETQIKEYEALVKELNSVIDNKDKIIDLTKQQVESLKLIIERFKEIENINDRIEKSYEEQLNIKDERIQLEISRRRGDILKYSILAFVLGAIGGAIAAH